MHRTLPLVAALFPFVAAAQAPELDLSWSAPLPTLRVEEPEPSSPTSVPAETERTTRYEVNFRGRRLSVPDSILDIWYYDQDEPGYAAVTSKDRPDIGANALGVEFAIVGETGANGFFYFDYAASTMADGYWDDRESPPDHLDGNYLQPTDNLGFVALGADYMHELHLVRVADTGGKFGMSFLVGGGLGVLMVVGQIDEWEPSGGAPAFQRHARGDAPDGQTAIPKVFPMVDIQAALRFNFGDRLVLRLEGGLHDMLFYGGALGIRF